MNIIVISVQTRELGKNLKRSKKEFIWTFKINFEENQVKIINSILSGKKKIFFNEKLIFSEKKRSITFQHDFLANNIFFSAVQMGETFELFIAGKSFTELKKNETISSIPIQRKSLVHFEEEKTNKFYSPVFKLDNQSFKHNSNLKKEQNFDIFKINDPNFEKEKQKVDLKRRETEDHKKIQNMDLLDFSNDFIEQKNIQISNKPSKDQTNQNPLQDLYHNINLDNVELKTFETNKLFNRDPNNLFQSNLVNLDHLLSENKNIKKNTLNKANYDLI